MKAKHSYLYITLALAISAGLFIAYLSLNNFGSSGISSFPNMLEGTAFRPAIYRVLIPSLAKVIANLVPGQVSEFFARLPEGTGIKRAFDNLSNDMYHGEAVSALVLIYLSIVGFVLVQRRFLKELGYSQTEQAVLPFTLAALTLPFSVYFAYVYDLPQVFLFTVCALFLYQEKWTFYLLFLTVALLNKETAFFLVIIFAVYHFRRLPRNKFLVLLGAQLVIFLILRAILLYAYRDNPGVTIFWSYRYHLDQYRAHPSTLIVTLFLLGAITFLMAKNWQKKPAFLRSASIVFPFTVVLFFLAGMPMEFRVFLDILPVFGTLFFPRKTPQHLEEETIPVLDQPVHNHP
ncbi:MAG TPA: hypothetical protein VK897_17280 [Anaerolineales bacterium]|nr:hypothetical protein [Anaerolineales bacterium]